MLISPALAPGTPCRHETQMLDTTSHAFGRLPDATGVGYKPQHFSDIMAEPGAVNWLEIHAENYMGDGGQPLAQLRALAERFPISCMVWACPSEASSRWTRITWPA